jgi:hypothetical protein
LNFFDAIVGGGDGILYETAGALGKGERIFFLLLQVRNLQPLTFTITK